MCEVGGQEPDDVGYDADFRLVESLKTEMMGRWKRVGKDLLTWC